MVQHLFFQGRTRVSKSSVGGQSQPFVQLIIGADLEGKDYYFWSDIIMSSCSCSVGLDVFNDRHFHCRQFVRTSFIGIHVSWNWMCLMGLDYRQFPEFVHTSFVLYLLLMLDVLDGLGL